VQRLTRRVLVLAGVVATAACASQQFPPGGPVLHTTPKILALLPESNAVHVTEKHVVFRFDRVVSQTPAGGTTLENMFLVSPWTGPPSVSWHREHITVTPHKGIRPGTVYTVTMLPGITDLHGNSIKTTTVLTFATGDSIPATALRGLMFDWVGNKLVPKAIVEAITRPDSIVYITQTDSSGRFLLAHIPRGHYHVVGWLDANTNRKRDARELFDSADVTLTDSARVELLAFIHDTVGPRIGDVKPVDSTTLRVTFDKGLDVTQAIPSLRFRLVAADSTVVPLAGAQSAASADSVRAARLRAKDDSVARLDSLRRADSGVTGRDTIQLRRRALRRQVRRDSITLAAKPKPSRPSPITEVVVALVGPLKPGKSYRLSVDSVRNLQHAVRSSALAFTIPKAISRDSLAREDSLRAARRGRGRGAAPPGRATPGSPPAASPTTPAPAAPAPAAPAPAAPAPATPPPTTPAPTTAPAPTPAPPGRFGRS